jgi:hypothetical protein
MVLFWRLSAVLFALAAWMAVGMVLADTVGVCK